MCLTLTISKIKGKPVKVYKVLKYPALKSPVYTQYWKFGQIEETTMYSIAASCTLNHYENDLEMQFNVGFHSCRTLKSAYKIIGYNERIFEAEIPAYTSYIYGNCQEVLSQALSIKPYWYKPVKILGFRFFIRKKVKEDKLKE